MPTEGIDIDELLHLQRASISLQGASRSGSTSGFGASSGTKDHLQPSVALPHHKQPGLSPLGMHGQGRPDSQGSIGSGSVGAGGAAPVGGLTGSTLVHVPPGYGLGMAAGGPGTPAKSSTAGSGLGTL